MSITLVLILVIIVQKLLIYNVIKIDNSRNFASNLKYCRFCFIVQSAGLLMYDFYISLCSKIIHIIVKMVLHQACDWCVPVKKPLENTHFCTKAIMYQNMTILMTSSIHVHYKVNKVINSTYFFQYDFNYLKLIFKTLYKSIIWHTVL